MTDSKSTSPTPLAFIGALLTAPLFGIAEVIQVQQLETVLVIAVALLSQRIMLRSVSFFGIAHLTRFQIVKVLLSIAVLVLSFEWLRRHGADGLILLIVASTCFDIATTFLRSRGFILLSAATTLSSYVVIALAGLSVWQLDTEGLFLVSALALAASCATVDFSYVARADDMLIRRSFAVIGLFGPVLICLLANIGLVINLYFLILISAYPLWRVLNGKETSLCSAGAMHHMLFFATLIALRAWL